MDLVDRLGLAALARPFAKHPGPLDEAWERCERPDVLILLATHLGVEQRRVVRAATALVGLGLPLLRDLAVAPRALAVVARWTRGEASLEECWAAQSVTSYLAGCRAAIDPEGAAVLSAIAFLAMTCVPGADGTWTAGVVEASVLTVQVLHRSDAGSGAGLVRDELPWRFVEPYIERVFAPAPT